MRQPGAEIRPQMAQNLRLSHQKCAGTLRVIA
jgi:hypothetical protein